MHPEYERMSLRKTLAFAGAAIVAALATGAAFAAWFNHGDAIFISLIQSGLAWCL